MHRGQGQRVAGHAEHSIAFDRSLLWGWPAQLSYLVGSRDAELTDRFCGPDLEFGRRVPARQFVFSRHQRSGQLGDRKSFGSTIFPVSRAIR